ncbi:MAG TPA: dihydrolipoamide dehydrogenase, partial [Stellaceae bacterium]|nr:dihydrolipoamide dehydrogenase [Stellaceae bacterium]
NDRAQAERTPHGHIKVIVDNKGRILGVGIVGAQAGELISAWSLAIAQRLTVRAFTDLVVPYPTLSEIGKRASVEYYLPGLTQPLLRRIIRFLRNFG